MGHWSAESSPRRQAVLAQYAAERKAHYERYQKAYYKAYYWANREALLLAKKQGIGVAEARKILRRRGRLFAGLRAQQGLQMSAGREG